MKNLLRSASFLLLNILMVSNLLTATVQAKIWRVDNNGGSPGDFTTAQAAHDAAAVVANDTLYFNGSGTGYGNLTMDKRLYVFGPGYFLTENPETQAAPNTAVLGVLRLNPGAAGSIVTGMTMFRAFLFASNTLFKRNYIASNDHALCIGDTGDFFATYTPSNVLCVQNYVSTSGGGRALWVNGGCSNIIVTNNYFNAGDPSWPAVVGESSMIFSNNTILGTMVTTSTAVTNSHLTAGNSVSGPGTGTTYQNNISNSTQFPSGNGNIQNTALADVCVNTGSSDGKFKLKAGSPAIGAGVGMVDIGMYGGADPYVLSGLPSIPAIWSFSAPSSGSGTGGLQVTIKAKSHN